MLKTASPCKNRGNWIIWGCTTLLPYAIVAINSTVGCFWLQNTIFIDTNWSHQTERSETLSNNVWLYVTIIVLASPNETSFTFNCLGYHIINKAMLITASNCQHFVLVILFVFFSKNIHEESVVFLKNGVFSRKLEGEFTLDTVLEARFSKWSNWFISVEHTKVAASIWRLFELMNQLSGRCTSISWCENKFNFTSFCDYVVLAAILVSISVSTNDNWLSPSWNESRDVADDNRFTKNSSI